MKPTTPHTGDVYAKSYSSKFEVFIIAPITQICDGGWFCLAQVMFRDGTLGQTKIVSIMPDDRLCSSGNRLTRDHAKTLRCHRKAQRRTWAAYRDFDGCETREDGRAIYHPFGV